MSKEKTIIGTILGILVFFWIVSLFLGLGSFSWIPTIVSSFLLITLLLWGLRTASPEERVVIEILGEFYGVKGPGLFWIFPGLMRIRAIVSIWEQSLVLFRESIKVDFHDGSATPKGVEAFVKVKEPDRLYRVEDIEGEGDPERSGVYRAIYSVDNWRARITELLENATRSYLSTLTIDDALTQKRGGFDVANSLPPEESKKIRETLKAWGFDLMRVTITDFDLEPDLVEARGEVQKRKREAEAAEYEKKVRARETVGALVQMIAESTGKKPEEIQAEIAADPERSRRLREFSEELITRRMSIDGRSLLDIRTAGGGNLEQSLLTLIGALRMIPSSPTREGSERE